MRDEEKLLRIKINELEKKKNQCSQEIDMKQRTIQQLKEQLNNQKVEEAIQQYERVCKGQKQNSSSSTKKTAK